MLRYTCRQGGLAGGLAACSSRRGCWCDACGAGGYVDRSVSFEGQRGERRCGQRGRGAFSIFLLRMEETEKHETETETDCWALRTVTGAVSGGRRPAGRQAAGENVLHAHRQRHPRPTFPPLVPFSRRGRSRLGKGETKKTFVLFFSARAWPSEE